MKFIPCANEYLNNPSTGLPYLKEEYILEGDLNGHAYRSPILIDVRLDLIALRRIVDDLIPAYSAKYILQVPNVNLPNAQALNELTAGLMKQTSGVVATAIPGEDYMIGTLTNDHIWLGKKVGAKDNVPTESPQILFKNLPPITNGSLITGANVGGIDNVAKEITKISNDNLPDLPWRFIMVGGLTSRPSVSENYIKGPSIPFAVPNNLAVWDEDVFVDQSITGRTIKDTGFSITTLETMKEYYTSGPFPKISKIGNIATWSDLNGRHLADSGFSVPDLEEFVTICEAAAAAAAASAAASAASATSASTSATAAGVSAASAEAADISSKASAVACSTDAGIASGAATAAGLSATAASISAIAASSDASSASGHATDANNYANAAAASATSASTSLNILLTTGLNALPNHGDVNIASYKISNLSSGTLPGDAVNFSQLSSAISGAGTVTSVGATGSTGLVIGGSPIVGAGTLTFTLSSGLQYLSTIASANNGALVTNGTGVPTISSTLPSAVQGNITTLGVISTGTWNASLIPGQYGGSGVNNSGKTITLGGNLITSGAFSTTLTVTGATNVTLPTSGTLVNSAVTTLSSLSSIGTISSGVWNGTVIPGQYGGSGVNNSGKTITLGGNLSTSGAFDTTFTVTALTNVTLPTSGTLVNSAVTTLSSLSSVGTLTTGVWNATTIAVAKGGTGLASTTAYGVLCGGLTSTGNLQNAGTGTAGQVLTSSGAAALPVWQTPTVGTLTSITAGTGLTGGTITTSGTIALANTAVTAGSYTFANFTVDAQGRLTAVANGANPLLVSNNLSDLSNATTSRANLGLTNVSIATPTQNAVQIGGASNTLSSISLASGQILMGSTGFAPLALTLAGGTNISWSIGSGTLSVNLTGQVSVANGGTGLSSTVVNQLLYSSSNNVISGLATANNGVLITSALGVPSISSTLPSGVQGNITALGSIVSGTWGGSIVSPTFGGTGVNNSSKTIALGGNLTTAGAFDTTLTVTALTNVTLPTSGTLVNTAVTTLSSLASVGTITSGTWSATTIALNKGGTGAIDAINARANLGLTNISTQTVTSNAILQGASSNGITSRTLTNGQLLIGSTGLAPVATIPGDGTNISWTSGAGTLTANLSGQVSISNGGTGASTAATARANLGVTDISTQTVTQYSVLLGGAGNTINSLAQPNIKGKILLSGATNQNPGWSNFKLLDDGINLILSSSSAGNLITTGVLNFSLGNQNFSNITSASYAIAIGGDALSSLTTGVETIAIGQGALRDVTINSNNVAVGSAALGILNGLNVNNNNNTAVGDRSGRLRASYINCTFLGSGADSSIEGLTNASSVGYNAIVNTSNSIQLGNTSITTAKIGNASYPTSASNTSNFARGDGNWSNVIGGGLGIGGASPAGSAFLQFNNPVQNRVIALYDLTGSTTEFYGFGINGGILRYQVPSSANHVFYSGGTELMRLNNNCLSFSTGMGSVNRKIAFYGESNDHEFMGFGLNAATLRYQTGSLGHVHAWYTGTSSTTSNLLMTLNGYASLTLNSGNAYKTGGGSWIATSDSRIKNVSGEYTHGLSEIVKINVRKFKYNEKSEYSDKELEKERIGIIAQEIENILPECIVGSQKIGKINDIRLYDSTPLIYTLVNAVKELNSKIERLEKIAA